MLTLPRTGDRPLQFEGEPIAIASSEHLRGDGDATRWHELALYLLKGSGPKNSKGRAPQQYILAIGYRTRWQGELDHDQAEAFDSLEDVVTFLKNHDPTGGVLRVRGQGAAYEGLRRKEIRRLAELSERWDAAVSLLLAELPEVIE